MKTLLYEKNQTFKNHFLAQLPLNFGEEIWYINQVFSKNPILCDYVEGYEITSDELIIYGEMGNEFYVGKDVFFESEEEAKIYLASLRQPATPEDELFDLKAKIKNGTLIELPCKIGTEVATLYKDCEKCIHAADLNDYCLSKNLLSSKNLDKDCKYNIFMTPFKLEHLERWGKSVFATREEAEKKIAEINK